MCRQLSRRELIEYSGLVAASFALRPVVGPLRGFAVALGAVPMNLELVTVTDTEAALTWFTGDPTRLDQYHRPEPVPADTTFYLGTSPLSMERMALPGETAYHRVDLAHLRRGTTYYYRAESNGLPATPASVEYGELPASGSFTTMVPPPGRELGRVAWLNDVHFGELVSGLALGSPVQLPPGFPVDPSDPYWQFMATTAIIEARARGARLMLVNGDVTNEAEPSRVGEAKALFDTRFGSYRRDYFVNRGNHDRPHSGTAPTGEQYSSCSARKAGLDDCLADAFFPDGISHFSVGMENRRFIGLDSVAPSNGFADISGEFGYLEAELAAHAREPTFVLFHHPATPMAGLTWPGGVIPGDVSLPPDQAQTFIAMVGGAAQVKGVYNGHTHRNFTSSDPRSAALPYMEFGAVKEYPGGYTILRLFEGGYMVNFWKSGGSLAPADLAERCRMWSERSRGEYLGLYPYGTLGRFADRNAVHVHELVPGTGAGVESGGSSGQPGALPGAGSTSAAGVPNTEAGSSSSIAAPAIAATLAGAAALAGRRMRQRADP